MPDNQPTQPEEVSEESKTKLELLQAKKDDLADLVGLLRTISFEGKEYQLSPIPVVEYAKFRSWCLDEHLAYTEEMVDKLKKRKAPKDMVRAFWQEAIEQAKNPVASPACLTMAGTRKTLLLSLLPKHPDATEELVDRIIGDAASYLVACEVMALLNVMDIKIAGS